MKIFDYFKIFRKCFKLNLGKEDKLVTAIIKDQLNL